MKAVLLAVLALPLVAASQPVESGTGEDVRCFSALMVAADNESEEEVAAIAIVSQYYLGRIDALAPDLDLEAAIVREVEDMSPSDIASALQRCSSRVEQRGQDLIELGKRLEQREAQAAPSST